MHTLACLCKLDFILLTPPFSTQELGLQDGSVIVADDFLQDYELRISIVHKAYVKDQPEYEVIAAAEDLVPKPIQEEEKKNGNCSYSNVVFHGSHTSNTVLVV